MVSYYIKWKRSALGLAVGITVLILLLSGTALAANVNVTFGKLTVQSEGVNGESLSSSIVTVYNQSTGSFLNKSKTGSDGNISFYLANGTYKVEIKESNSIWKENLAVSTGNETYAVGIFGKLAVRSEGVNGENLTTSIVRVYNQSTGAYVNKSKTGSDGNISFYLANGTYNVEIKESNSIFKENLVVVAGKPTNTTGIFGKLTVRSKGVNGEPLISNVKVYNQTTSVFCCSKSTISLGNVSFYLAPGNYSVEIIEDNSLPLIQNLAVSAGNETYAVGIFGKLTVRSEGVNGEPLISIVKVYNQTTGAFCCSKSTSSQGNVSFYLAPGNYSVEVKEDNSIWRENLVVFEGKETYTVAIFIFGRLNVYVNDSNGIPWNSFKVDVYNQSTKAFVVSKTSSNTNMTYFYLAPGTYNVNSIIYNGGRYNQDKWHNDTVITAGNLTKRFHTVKFGNLNVRSFGVCREELNSKVNVYPNGTNIIVKNGITPINFTLLEDIYDIKVFESNEILVRNISVNNISIVYVDVPIITKKCNLSLNITSSIPSSDPTTLIGNAQSFAVTLNRSADVTWYFNGFSVQSNISVTSASYSNNNAGVGVHNVTIVASDGDETVSRTWNWTVVTPIALIVLPDNSTVNTRYVNVTATLDRPGNAFLKWDGGGIEPMGGPGMSFYMNKTGLLSGRYSFSVFANDSLSSANATRTVTVDLMKTTNISGYIDPSTGNLSQDIILVSPSRNVTVSIFNGTNATVKGTALNTISIDSPAGINATPGGFDRFVGENVALDPANAGFIPDIQMRFNYTDLQLTTAGITDAGTLRIIYYDSTSGSYVVLATYTFNQTGKYIIVNASHFGTFALIGTAPTPPCTTCGGSINSGGGGGGVSTESYSNIQIREKVDLYIFKDKLTSYIFRSADPILNVNITGNISAGEVTATIEVLKNTSNLVKGQAPGLIYKNVNIFVGTSGFAMPKNIKEAFIRFKVNNAWMSTNSVSASDIKLVKWDGSKWIKLETKVLSKDEANTFFEGKTNAFSPFAISATTREKTSEITPSISVIQPEITATPAITKTLPSEILPQFNLYTIIVFIAVIGIILAVGSRRKGKFKK